ncbi:P110/LppT family adhesin N-terminal domain [Mesomycoplasma hyopneumoniae]|uniref:P110/LppT family adhesin N-terminal domain n=1 Tax=Mesomycoplasma hyopneumoniae TaxID=2099 RepID=UPI001367B112|nr:P110/LppT family adhesin N-terminal domain [Mesomycoplasma hyopneumoniae]MXR33617.1 oxidoreductase [Mesomycoplasma hyopneumoniae]
MKKQIRNKAIIVLAGLSFIGITAGVGLAVQNSALRSSYLNQFKNDKSATELLSPINDTELSKIISNFSLKENWSKISAAQAFELHKNPLYAFKLTDAIDFSKIDKKFAHLFFNVQVNDNTKVEGNSIRNLTVFVFDAITKKEVATRAFHTSLSGFSSVAKEDFIENFVAESSTYELDKDQLKKNFATEIVLPSAFSIKFQDVLLTHLRKTSPESFQETKTIQVRALTNSITEFQQQQEGGSGGSGGSTGGSSSGSTDQKGQTSQSSEKEKGKDQQSTQGSEQKQDQKQEKPKEAEKPAQEKPAQEKPAEAPKVAAPVIEPVKKLVFENEKLNQALLETLKDFGGLKLLAASGLQGLLPNEYTLLPVSSDKSLIKLDIDDQAGTASIHLKLLDKNKKEKNLILPINGLASIGAIKDKVFSQIFRNQNAYLTIRPQINEYLRKNPRKKIQEVIWSFSREKFDQLRGQNEVEKFLEELYNPTQTSQSPQKSKSSDSGKSNIATIQASPETAPKTTPTPTTNSNTEQSSTSTNNQSSKETSSETKTTQEQANPETNPKAKPEAKPEAKPAEKPINLEDQAKTELKEILKIHGWNYRTLLKDQNQKVILPDNINFWFDLRNKRSSYENYKLEFDFAKKTGQIQAGDVIDANKIRLNLKISPLANLKLEVDSKNKQYIDAGEIGAYVEFDKQGKKLVEQGKSLDLKVGASATNSIFSSEIRYSAYELKGWTYPIDIDIKGNPIQQELEKLVGNYHRVRINKNNQYQIYSTDIDKIFAQAKLDKYFELSQGEKQASKKYLQEKLNPISEITIVKLPPKEEVLPPLEEEKKPEQDQKPQEKQEDKQNQKPQEKQEDKKEQEQQKHSQSPEQKTETQTQSQEKDKQTSSETSPSNTNESSGAQNTAQNSQTNQTNSGQGQSQQAASSSASYQSHKITTFQDDQKGQTNEQTEKEIEPEKLAFGDYLVKYLDIFETFKVGPDQKLSIGRWYNAPQRTYNVIFRVLDKENIQVAASLFQLHGISATNIALEKSLRYAPDIFLDGTSGLEYKQDTGDKPYLQGRQFVSAINSINNTKSSYRVHKLFDNLPLSEESSQGLRLKSSLVYDYQKNDPYTFQASKEALRKTALTKGVLYLAFKPEQILGIKGSKTAPGRNYKLLSTTNVHFKSLYGLSNLELVKTKYQENLKLVWKLIGAKPVNDDKILPPQVADLPRHKSTEIILLEDSKPGASSSDQNKVNSENKEAETFNLDIRQTKPNQIEPLEHYLGQTWLMEIRIDDESATITIIPEQQEREDSKLKVWKSEIKIKDKNKYQNQDTNWETELASVLGRGFDYGQIGDTTPQASNPQDRVGMTFKGFAVFKGDKLLNDKARLNVRKAFMDQYFKNYS